MRPISFASRSLSETEQRYSQTEREALAVKYGCLKFHHYLSGDPQFTVHTDHKPLLQLLRPGSRPPPRIERMALAVQDLTFTLEYNPGAGNPADVLSRHPLPLPSEPNVGEIDDAQYIAAILRAATPNAVTLEDIRVATAGDSELQAVLASLQTGDWRPTNSSMRSFFAVRDELSACNGCLLRNDHLVIPTSLRLQVLQLAHQGHQGIVRTRARLNSKVWWPRMSSDAEHHVQQCRACAATAPPSHNQVPPPIPTPATSRPFQYVSTDLYGPLPSGEYLLAIVDQFTRYPEVAILHSTSSHTVITHLRRVFSRYGIPETLMTDNGPQFTSAEFYQFLRRFGIRHRTSTPLWPQANGGVERLNRSIGKILQAAVLEGIDKWSALDEWLLAYRNTPHPATKKSPAELLFRVPPRDTLPDISRPSDADLDTAATELQFRADRCNKAAQDRRAQPHGITSGQQVLRRNEVRSKLTPPWDPLPWTVTNVDGDAVQLARDGVTTTRHTSFVKPADPQSPRQQLEPTPSAPSVPTESAHSSTEDDDTPIARRPHPRAAKEASPYGH